MTLVEVCFRYSSPPGETQMRALSSMREVYGIRAIRMDTKNRTITVEFDASRLQEGNVESLLRRADFDLAEKVALV